MDFDGMSEEILKLDEFASKVSNWTEADDAVAIWFFFDPDLWFLLKKRSFECVEWKGSVYRIKDERVTLVDGDKILFFFVWDRKIVRG